MDDGLVRDCCRLRKCERQFKLILVVVDNGPVLSIATETIHAHGVVLILVVVDNGLVRFVRQNVNHFRMSLNPYCSGQWSRTRTIYYLMKLSQQS